MRLGKAIFIAGMIGFGVAGMAFADDVTFAASGTFDDGASLGGTLVIDTASGVVESNGLDLTVIGGDAGSPGLVFDTLRSNGFFFDGTDNLYYIDASRFRHWTQHSARISISPQALRTLVRFYGRNFLLCARGLPCRLSGRGQLRRVLLQL